MRRERNARSTPSKSSTAPVPMSRALAGLCGDRSIWIRGVAVGGGWVGLGVALLVAVGGTAVALGVAGGGSVAVGVFAG